MLLLDRREEVGAIDRLLGAVREGSSGVLVLSGEPGIGKSTLLDYAAQVAADLQVARSAAVESEMRLPYASLHQLLVPFLPRLERIPAPQRRAIRTVLGLESAAAPDRFLIGLGTLTLLEVAASARPLLCLVDDAQWLDQESADVLAFVSRRIYADRIGLVFAVRKLGDRPEALTGLPEIRLDGLPDAAAHELLSSGASIAVHRQVAERILAKSRGNPLALTEITGELTRAQLAGESPLPDPMPLGPRLEERFRRQIRAQGADTQTLLLLAAADPSGDLRLLQQAAAQLHFEFEPAAIAAERAGLLVLEPTVRFRHPLIRSAAYHGPPRAQRQRIHAALAAVTDPEDAPDRRALHLAAAAIGFDEDLAAELERSAERARQRGGYAAAASLLERSVELTSDPARRGARLLAVAFARLTAGAPDRAEAALEQATPALADPLQRAQARRLLGAILFETGHPAEVPSILLDAARAFEPLDAGLVRDTLLEALEVSFYAGKAVVGSGAREVAVAARSAPRRPGADEVTADLLLDGLSELLAADYETGVSQSRRAIAKLRGRDLDGEERLRLLGLAFLAAGEMFDDAAQYELASEWVRLARERGAMRMLLPALADLAMAEIRDGKLARAEAYFSEADEFTAATTSADVVSTADPRDMLALAWRGDEARARAAATSYMREAISRGQGGYVCYVRYSLGVLELGLGQYAAALSHSHEVFREDPVYMGTLVLPELVEAAVRAGNAPVAGSALDRLAERVNVSRTRQGLGLLARSRALLADGEVADQLYRLAIDHLSHSRTMAERARAHLLYGEWLRRRRRRRDARDQLRMAHELFIAMGAGAFEERARIELLATGEHAKPRRDEVPEALTAQEAQVARLAAEGNSNSEIAHRLFISASTVAYHLRKVFRKLDISSRNQLAGRL